MTVEQLYTLLTGTGLSVAYSAFPGPKEPPFITYQFVMSNDLVADGQNYVKVARWQVELYTNKKDIASEQAVESALSDLVYTKSEYWIAEEKMFQVVYEFETLLEV
jgi:hypothetical protein